MVAVEVESTGDDGMSVNVGERVQVGLGVACSVRGVDGTAVWTMGVSDAVGVPLDPHAVNTIPITIQHIA